MNMCNAALLEDTEYLVLAHPVSCRCAGLEAQKRAAGKNRRKVSRNPFGRFGFRGSR